MRRARWWHRGVIGLVAPLALAACSPGQQQRESTATPPTACSPGQMRIVPTATDSVMNQPFVVLTARNRGPSSCLLDGYPGLRVRGTLAPGHHPESFPVRLHHGVYEHHDPGPHAVAVAPGHAAFFYVGTETAAQGGRYLHEITRLAVTLPGTRRAQWVAVHLAATRRPSHPYRVGVTAFEAAPTRPLDAEVTTDSYLPKTCQKGGAPNSQTLFDFTSARGTKGSVRRDIAVFAEPWSSRKRQRLSERGLDLN